MCIRDRREPGLAASDAAERFGAAYGSMLARLRAAYPHAEVWCCTLCPGRVVGRDGSTFAYRLRGAAFDAYNEAIRAAARAHGCRVADVRARGRDYEGLEVTHPTARGMRQFAALVLHAMAAECGEPLPADDPALLDAPPSAERCAEPSCIGCPHAASTGGKWLLVCNRP